MNLEERKYQLIKKIATLQDEDVLNRLELIFEEYSKTNRVFSRATMQTRERLDVEQLKIEQNYPGFDKEEVNRLIKEINLQEPIELLLKMI